MVGGMDILNFSDVDIDEGNTFTWDPDEYYEQADKYQRVAGAMGRVLEEVYLNKYAILLIREKEGAIEQVQEAISKMLALRKLIDGLYAEDINANNKEVCDGQN